MKNFNTGSLEIRIKEVEGKNIMEWFGICQEPKPGIILNPYFQEILEDLKEKELEIKFNELVYVNSAMVAPLVYFINTLNINQINTIISFNKDSVWQQLSFKALANVVRNMKYIKILL